MYLGGLKIFEEKKPGNMYIYGAPFRKKIKLFCAQNIFLMQHHLVFVNMKHFFVQRFCRHQITFCATFKLFVSTQNYYYCVTPNFSFGHCLECYVMVIYFYCHIATKI